MPGAQSSGGRIPADYLERIDLSTADPLRLAQHLERYRFAARYAQGRSVLDAACGTGYGAALLADAGAARVIGLDCDPPTICQNRVHFAASTLIQFQMGDVCALPFPAAAFDLYVSLETLEHVQDAAACIQQAHHVLAPGGMLILSTPNAAITNVTAGSPRQPANPYHMREYHYAELVALLGDRFHIEAVFGQCLLPRRLGPWLLANAVRATAARRHRREPPPPTKNHRQTITRRPRWLTSIVASPRCIPPSRRDAWLQPLYWLLVARRI